MSTLRDIMTPDVARLDEGLTLREAAEILSSRQISGAPVVQDGKVLGVLSVTDIVDFAARAPGASSVPRPRAAPWDVGAEPAGTRQPSASQTPTYFTDLWSDAGADILERFTESEIAGWNVLEEHGVDELMNRELYALPPDTELDEAARYMLDKDVHRVLVMEGEALVGLVTTTDFLRAIAERKI